MIYRHINALYWLGRYVERAENTARIVNVNYHASMKLQKEHSNYSTDDDDGPFSLNPWTPTEPSSMVRWLILDEENPSSVASSISQAHLNAQTTRNKIDEESWEAINRAYLKCGSPDSSILEEDQLSEYCTKVLRILHEFTGTLDSNMFRGESWYYIWAGRFLERADNCLRQVEVFLTEYDRDASDLRTRTVNRLFLESIGATMLLERFNTQSLGESEAIVKFLLTSIQSPRSFRFCLDQLHEMLAELQARYFGKQTFNFNELTSIRQELESESTELTDRSNYSDWLELLAEFSKRLTSEFQEGNSSAESLVADQSIQTQQ